MAHCGPSPVSGVVAAVVVVAVVAEVKDASKSSAAFSLPATRPHPSKSVPAGEVPSSVATHRTTTGLTHDRYFLSCPIGKKGDVHFRSVFWVFVESSGTV